MLENDGNGSGGDAEPFVRGNAAVGHEFTATTGRAAAAAATAVWSGSGLSSAPTTRPRLQPASNAIPG